MARMPKAVMLSASGLGLLLVLVLNAHRRLNYTDGDLQYGLQALLERQQFSWDDLPTTKELRWRPCDTGLECTRLEVPLNYSEPEGRKASIALIRRPAEVPENSRFYRGPILFNPGGPGGSGVDLVKVEGDLLSKFLGPQFDIVGFDPRGISRSTPAVSFFRTKAERVLWAPHGRIELANNTDEGIARTWARSVVVNQLAAETDDGYLRHINTDNTARDMLRIVEAHGRQKIQYWGFSYGSVLGATFATMFPDRIDRLVIDGVVDAENYYSTLWSDNLVDTDKAFESFLTGCVDAGPKKCAFWASTSSDIKANLTNLLQSVRSKPFPVRTKTRYGLLDYTLLRSALFTSLYTPYESFPSLAQGLADLAKGDGTRLFDMVNPEPFHCECHSTQAGGENVLDGGNAVACNDGDEIPADLESAEEYFKMMMEASSWSEIWATRRLRCVSWPKYPKSRFRGPFNVSTSHPILLIGNTADPVTPLWAAHKMSKGFKDSVVLTQNSAGHCSTSAPSICTQQHIRDYFMDGTLPKPGTVCQPISSPFDVQASFGPLSISQATMMSSSMTANEQEIYAAISELSRHPGIISPFDSPWHASTRARKHSGNCL